MHQKAFGGRALPRPAGGAPPDPLAAIWGLLLRGGEGKGGKGRGGERRKGRGGEGKVSPPLFCSSLRPWPALVLNTPSAQLKAGSLLGKHQRGSPLVTNH